MGGVTEGLTRYIAWPPQRPQRAHPFRQCHPCKLTYCTPRSFPSASRHVTVVTRLAKPAIAAVALFSFLYTFNDFFLPLLYVGENPHKWVLSIGLSQFRSLHQVQWNLTMAATLLVMAPVIVLFFLAQRAFVEGVTLTGVKG